MSNEHTVKSYEEELRYLIDSVIKMGSLTETQLVDSMDAVIKVDKDSIDKIMLLSPAGLFGEPKSIPFPFNQIGASFLGLQQVRRSLCRQAFAFPDECVGEMEEQIASIHLGCKGWRNSLASFAKSGGFAGTHKYIQNIPIKTLCGENDRILGKKEIQNIRKIDKLNFIGLQNCGHLPHVDLPSLSSKIIQDYFLE